MILKRNLALGITLVTVVHLCAMKNEVKQIANHDLPAPQLTFHHFPVLPDDMQKEILSRFIPADLAQTENVLDLFKRVGELAIVNTKFAQTLIECLKNPALLERAAKGQIHDSLLCKGYVLRTISRALIKDRLVAIARSVVEGNPLKNAEKLLAQTLSELQTEIKADPPGAVEELAINFGPSTPLRVSKLRRFKELLNPALQELCPEITFLARAYLKHYSPVLDHIKEWVSKSKTIPDQQLVAERALLNQLFSFLGLDAQLGVINDCRLLYNVRFYPQNDLNNRLIATPHTVCRDSMVHPEECLSTLLKDSHISDTYKYFLTALRDANIPMIRALMAKDFNNYLRDVLLSFALCYAIGKNDEALIQMFLAYSLSPEMLLFVLELVIEGEFPSLHTILSHLEVSSNTAVHDKLNANLISYINQAYRQDIVKALCSKLNYPAAIINCIEACMNNSEEQIESSIALSSDLFDRYSIQIVILMLLRNGNLKSIHTLRTTLTKIFLQNLDDGEIEQTMHAFIRLADSHNQPQIAEYLRIMHRKCLIKH
jgi:hypothetical protein